MLVVKQTKPTASTIAELFPNLEAFKHWAEDLMIHDLIYWEGEFADEELYEHCVILRDLQIDYNNAVNFLSQFNGLMR